MVVITVAIIIHMDITADIMETMVAWKPVALALVVSGLD